MAKAQNSQGSAKRGKGKPFQPGQSGNPGGRPKEDAEVKELARQHTRAAVERLVFWMASDNAKASVSACGVLLDRGWGKAPQYVNVEGVPTVPLFAVSVMPSVAKERGE